MSDSDQSPTPLLRSIDLNADLGEGCQNDRGLMEFVSSASICCGAHAGGPDVMLETLERARAYNVAVGAHPGYDDRAHFGRKELLLDPEELSVMLHAQLEALHHAARPLHVPICYLKPHGALYNQAQREPGIAEVVVAVAAEWKLALLGQPGTLLDTIATGRGLPYIREGFPDRRYQEDGSLIPRSQPNAVIHDLAELEAQVLRLVADPRMDTLCVHGDDPNAIDNAMRVRKILIEHGIVIQPFARGPV
jgi:UPF0271 protein